MISQVTVSEKWTVLEKQWNNFLLYVFTCIITKEQTYNEPYSNSAQRVCKNKIKTLRPVTDKNTDILKISVQIDACLPLKKLRKLDKRRVLSKVTVLEKCTVLGKQSNNFCCTYVRAVIWRNKYKADLILTALCACVKTKLRDCGMWQIKVRISSNDWLKLKRVCLLKSSRNLINVERSLTVLENCAWKAVEKLSVRVCALIWKGSRYKKIKMTCSNSNSALRVAEHEEQNEAYLEFCCYWKDKCCGLSRASGRNPKYVSTLTCETKRHTKLVSDSSHWGVVIGWMHTRTISGETRAWKRAIKLKHLELQRHPTI